MCSQWKWPKKKEYVNRIYCYSHDHKDVTIDIEPDGRWVAYEPTGNKIASGTTDNNDCSAKNTEFKKAQQFGESSVETIALPVQRNARPTLDKTVRKLEEARMI